ncbi:MAG: signal peptidase II [Actinobacteria bacterium]|nr:signal peptidase II [Actinomycetota bacterium]
MISRKGRNALLTVYFLFTAVCVLIADQVSKHFVIQRLPENTSIQLIPRVLSITHITNTGAAFGIFQDYTRVLIVISSVAIVLIIVLKLLMNLDSVFYNISLGFVLGGALGNLVDRYFVGRVVDFISLSFFGPIFNVADSFILIGFCIIIVLILKEYLRRGKPGGVE